MNIAKAIALTCVPFLVVTSANAQQYDAARETTGPYIGVGYNYLDFNEDFGGSGHVNAVTARAGWQFLPFLSAEAEASFGIDNGEFDYNSSEDEFDLDDNIDGDLDDVIRGPGELGMDYLIGFFGRATFPISDQFDISAKAGYAFVELDSTVRTMGGNELVFGGSDDGFAFGAGASYDVTEAFSIRADYTRYEFDTADADSFGISLNLKFGG